MGAASSVNKRYRPHGEGSTTGAADRALPLEPDWSRNAYGARYAAHPEEGMTGVINRTGTMTSMLWTEDDTWVSLRTARIDASLLASMHVSSPERRSTSTYRSAPRPASGCSLTMFWLCNSVQRRRWRSDLAAPAMALGPMAGEEQQVTKGWPGAGALAMGADSEGSHSCVWMRANGASKQHFVESMEARG